jgi:hypothetical protein
MLRGPVREVGGWRLEAGGWRLNVDGFAALFGRGLGNTPQVSCF